MNARAHIDGPALVINSLRRVGRKLITGNEDEQVTGRVIELLLDGRPLDEVLGLPEPGQRSLSTKLATAARDQLLREAANRFFPDQSLAEQARELSTALHCYATSAWRRERAEVLCPTRHVGRIEAVCWQILKHRDLVLTPRRIRAILAMS